MGKKINYQLIHKSLVYTIKDICKKLRVSKSAVKYWVKLGLTPIDYNDRPWLFKGSELKRFLKVKYKDYKLDLEPGEFYCLSCRFEVDAIPSSLWLDMTKRKLGDSETWQIIIRGICEVCGHTVVRLSSTKQINDILKPYSESEMNNENN